MPTPLRKGLLIEIRRSLDSQQKPVPWGWTHLTRIEVAQKLIATPRHSEEMQKQENGHSLQLLDGATHR
jgi:hypothetical protein